uniref:Uncharacterized protein n=1 Tax=Neobacillus citreus TaxID=2833578 RepID=A0A942SXE6_9BACI
MTSIDTSAATKLQALRTRRSLEHHTTTLWAAFAGKPIESVSVGHVVIRLHLALARVPEHRRRVALTAVRKAAITYKETSDVLHGRMRGAHVTQARLAEWQESLAAFVALLTESKQEQ